MRNFLLVFAVLATAFSGCLNADEPSPTTDEPTFVDANGDGVVVVAVVDGGFNPYHLDMVGTMMPQHLNDDPADDLPLHLAPHEWIPGFPQDVESAFASYNQIDLNLSYAAVPDDIDRTLTSGSLYSADEDAWKKVQAGIVGEKGHFNFFPGTKVVGMVSLGGDGFAASSHGVGTSTVSVGNIHGSCPECLLVFVNNGNPREAANNWVLSQDWIDVQTNSYGYSTVMRDRMYAGSDTEAQKSAVENGQAIFFSAGNGQGNTFTVPNPTLFSSQEGPDWIVTVGAIEPASKNSYQGHGKPADIASIGNGYPSGGYCDNTIACSGNFGGTSNATPVTAGMYAKALYELRNHEDAIVARPIDSPFIVQGVPVEGGYLDDGALTAPELMDALFLAAEHKSTGWVAGISGFSYPVQTAEMQFLSEGHGSYIGRLDGDDVWQAEIDTILRAAVHGEGEWAAGELDWFVVDSYCRQSAWGAWDQGAYNQTTPLPGASPNWPVRSSIEASCPTVVGTVADVERIRDT